MNEGKGMELKACPFCGGEPEVERTMSGEGVRGWRIFHFHNPTGRIDILGTLRQHIPDPCPGGCCVHPVTVYHRRKRSSDRGTR